MSIGGNGYWAVVETGQGGGLPDTLHGPFWDANEARRIAATMHANAHRVGRRDRFDVAFLDTQAADEADA